MKNEIAFFCTNFPNELFVLPFLIVFFIPAIQNAKKSHYALILGFKNNRVRRINDYYR